MKTHAMRGLRRHLFKVRCFSDYADQIGELEKLLARKPKRLQLDIIGSGELSADIALLMRSVLLNRSPKTHLVTNARSSLQGGAVLVWLMGDTRLVREDAKLYFRRPTEPEEDWKSDEESELDMDEVDYAQVLQHIDNFLPVKELAGKALDLEVLRQFGLVENERVDQFLAAAFARSPSGAGPPASEPGRHPTQSTPAMPCSEQSHQTE